MAHCELIVLPVSVVLLLLPEQLASAKRKQPAEITSIGFDVEGFIVGPLSKTVTGDYELLGRSVSMFRISETAGSVSRPSPLANRTGGRSVLGAL